MGFEQILQRVLDDTCGSDHYPIAIDSNLRVNFNVGFQYRRRLHSVKTNWGIFKKVLDNDIKKHLNNSVQDIDILYPSFISLIE